MPARSPSSWYDPDMERIFEDDDLDKAVSSADDTGLVAQQQIITEAEEAEGGIDTDDTTQAP